MKLFDQVSYHYSPHKKALLTCGKVKITSKYQPLSEIKDYVESYTKDFNAKLEQECGFSTVEIEARFDLLRTTETNASNLMADLVKT